MQTTRVALGTRVNVFDEINGLAAQRLPVEFRLDARGGWRGVRLPVAEPVHPAS